MNNAIAATQMGLEMVILSEGSQTEKEEYCMASLTWNLKRNCMNEIIYKKDSQRTNLWLLAGRGVGEWEEGIIIGNLGSTCTHGYV